MGNLRRAPASGSDRGDLIAPSTPPAAPGLVTGLAADASPGESLAPWTSLRIGGPAELLVRPRTGDALVSVLARARAEGLGVHVLGGGANTLVGDLGIRGVTVKLPPARPHAPAPAFRAGSSTLLGHFSQKSFDASSALTYRTCTSFEMANAAQRACLAILLHCCNGKTTIGSQFPMRSKGVEVSIARSIPL